MGSGWMGNGFSDLWSSWQGQSGLPGRRGSTGIEAISVEILVEVPVQKIKGYLGMIRQRIKRQENFVIGYGFFLEVTFRTQE